jgi:hypothetical protein
LLLSLSAEEILRPYPHLQEIERCFRVIESVLKLRPIYHHSERRVETHVFLTYLAFLLAKTLEQKLKAARLEVSVGWALEQLLRLKRSSTPGNSKPLVVRRSRLDVEVQAIPGRARHFGPGNPVLRISKPAAVA